MGNGFRSGCLDQPLLLPPDMRHWLSADHVVWSVIDLVSLMDLESFETRYRLDRRGGVAYDPFWMLCLLLFAYTQGVHSSRQIERLSREHVAYRVACAGLCPDHTTIARFRKRHDLELRELFVMGLRMCAQVGLTSLGVVAVDGTKLKANASGFRNVDKETLRARIDAYFDQPDDEDVATNVGFGNGKDFRARLARAREVIAHSDEQEDAEYARRVAKNQGKDTKGRKRGGRVKHPRESKNYKPMRVNLSDPDSRIMKTHAGFLQGYNLQALSNENQIILALDLAQQPNDAHQLANLVIKAHHNASQLGLGGIGEVLADSGYFQKEDLATLQEHYPGTELFVSAKGSNLARLGRRGPIPRNATILQVMERKMATKRGKWHYRKRKWMIEPVFARLKYQLGLKEIIRRGYQAAKTEAILTATAHNLLKYHQQLNTA